MSNEFIKVVVSDPFLRSSDVKRYSGTYMSDPEDILQHTTRVMFLSYVLAKKLSYCDETFDIGVLLEKGLLHDMDESLTGDVPRPVKYFTKEVHEGIGKLAEESARRLVSDKLHFKNKDSAHVLSCINECKKGKEGLLIKVSDLLVVASKTYEEIVLLNNLKFLKVANESRTYLSELCESVRTTDLINDKAKSYLGILVLDSLETMNNICHKYKDCIESLELHNYNLVRPNSEDE